MADDEVRAMDDDQRDLLRRLFAAATEAIEAAHDASIDGQSADYTARDYAGAARRLQAAGRDAVRLADAVLAIADRVDRTSMRPKTGA